mmetsp:Transcript_19620/g.42344  ORF Transcript_19620/g.42344 Transcript_19620/m.42344 type:complete len:291 (+) Transcript_19620:1053-1925(+)
MSVARLQAASFSIVRWSIRSAVSAGDGDGGSVRMASSNAHALSSEAAHHHRRRKGVAVRPQRQSGGGSEEGRASNEQPSPSNRAQNQRPNAHTAARLQRQLGGGAGGGRTSVEPGGGTYGGTSAWCLRPRSGALRTLRLRNGLLSTPLASSADSPPTEPPTPPSPSLSHALCSAPSSSSDPTSSSSTSTPEAKPCSQPTPLRSPLLPWLAASLPRASLEGVLAPTAFLLLLSCFCLCFCLCAISKERISWLSKMLSTSSHESCSAEKPCHRTRYCCRRFLVRRSSSRSTR